MNLWGWTFVVPLFHHSLDKVLSPSMAQIRTDWIITPNSLNDPNMCVWLEPKSTQTKESVGFRQNMFLSHLLQRKISSLSILKNLLSPIGLLLSKTTTNNMMQTQYFYREVIIIIILGSYIALFLSLAQSALHSITPARIASLSNLTYCCHTRRRSQYPLKLGTHISPGWREAQTRLTSCPRMLSHMKQLADMFDLPSQYAEEVETFRHVLDLPDPTKTMPRSSTTVLGLDDVKGQQEISPRGPSAMLPLRCL